MKTRTWLTIAVVAAVGLVAGIGIGAIAWAGGDHGTDTVAMAGTSTGVVTDSQAMAHGGHAGGASGTMGEQAFLEQMVPHHEAAIAMAQLALEKAKHPEIRRLARDIASSQDAEIQQMKAWHREWFGSALRPDTGATMMGTDVGALGAASGDDFDRAFLTMMIPHHASAVVMADSVMRGGPRQEIVQLSDEIISAQAKEIGRMQRWRELWYPSAG